MGGSRLLAAHRDAALNDFLLYLVLQGFRVEERDRKHIVTHREFDGSALMLIERAEMRGQPAFAGRFLRAMDDWVALDAPRLSDWIVEMDNYTKVEYRGMEIQLGDEFMQFRLGD